MRIAQVSPLYESVPPQLYGGTERIVYNLTEELVRMGHEVTLFASGDSETSARLIAPCAKSLRLSGCKEPSAPHAYMMELVRKEASQFDLIHFHTETMHMNIVRDLPTPSLTTMHGRLDLPEYVNLLGEFRDFSFVSISESQRKPVGYLNWQGTVYHGLSRERLCFSAKGGDTLVFLGRLSSDKGVDRAIEIARRTKMKLRVAAKVDHSDQVYLKRVKELLGESFVEYVGEIDDGQKSDFLGDAAALVFPIDWPEPFGLAMIEALACGTPVIAFSHGAVPEVIRDGVTGFVVSDIEGACEAVRKLSSINRRTCRDEFEERFTSSRMSRDYVKIYERILKNETREKFRDMSYFARPDLVLPAHQVNSPRNNNVEGLI